MNVIFELIKKDIDIICDLNCNCVRGSHYPNTKKTLDYCDEKGILFWEEIPLWGNRPEWSQSFADERFINRILNMHREMVLRDINHPSVVIWGLHNEVDNTLSQTRDLNKRIIETIREYDNTRLITYASNQDVTDECLDLVDVASFNKYIGWYGSEKDKSIEQNIEELRKKVNESGCEKPILMSEFGAAAIKGVTAIEAMRWSENYQAALLEKHIETYYESGEISGTFVWQFCDANTQNELAITRPRIFNNKGILDEYRRPKMAYETVKQVYKEYNPNADNESKVNLY